MIVFVPVMLAAAAQPPAPPPAPPAPPRAVEVPGYVARCEMATNNGRQFAATVTVAQDGKKRRATIVSTAPDLLPAGRFATDGAIQGGWHWSGRAFNEDIRMTRDGGFRVISSWSNRNGVSNLAVLPRGAKLTDPLTARGECRTTWSAA